jgi:hypothetical protein
MPASSCAVSACVILPLLVWWTHHDCLALVLNDVTGPANLIASTQAQEHELVGRVYRILVFWRQRGELPLGGHTG